MRSKAASLRLAILKFAGCSAVLATLIPGCRYASCATLQKLAAHGSNVKYFYYRTAAKTIL